MNDAVEASFFKFFNLDDVIDELKVSEKDEVVTEDYITIKAKIIRKNEEFDLILLKVNGTFNNAYKLPNNKQYSIGEDVFAIGIPSIINLSQTLSNGNNFRIQNKRES